MKKLIFLIVLSLIFTSNVTIFAQKRPTKKTTAPATKTKQIKKEPVKDAEDDLDEEAESNATPVSTPTPTPKQISPAENFFNDGLKCGAEDYDCQISNYTKAINVGLNTKEVFKNRGNAYLQRKDFDKAIADFTKLIELDLNDTNGYKNRGRIYLENSNSPQALNAAIRDFTSAIDLEPKDVEAYKLRSSAYMKLNNYDKAKADMDKIAAIDPNNVDVLINQGEMFLTSRQYDKAIEIFNKALSIKQSADVYLGRGKAYVEQKKYDLALADFNKAIELEPKNAEIYFNRGQTFWVAKKYDEAITDYTKTIELNPKHSQAYIHRGWIYLEVKEFDKASSDGNKAIEINPNEGGGYTLRATSRVYKNGFKLDAEYNADIEKSKSLDLQNAIKEFEANPQGAEAYIKRGEGYLNNQQYDLAIADYNKAIQLDTQNAYAYLRKGFAFVGKTQYDLALNEFTKAIEIEPRNTNLYQARASYLRIQKQFDLAIKDYTKAIELEPQNVNFYNSRAESYTSQKQFDLAINDYTKAYELEPTESRLGNLMGGLIKSGQAVSALELYVSDYCKTFSDKCFPNDAKIYSGRFPWTFSMDNELLDTNLEKALPFYTNAVKENPQDVMNYLWRAEILSELGMGKEAIEDFNKCVAIDNGKGQYCKGRAEGIKSNITSAEYERKRLKREKRNQALLKTMGAITQGLEIYNTAQQNTATSQIPQPNISSRPQTTQSGNTNNSSLSTNTNNNTTSQNDPDFPAAMKGNTYINQSAPSYRCNNNLEGKIERCWGNWRADSNYSQIQYSVLGPVQHVSNAIDNTPNVKSQFWHIQVKNTSNSIVEFKLKVVFGDGKETWVYFALPPGGSAYKPDFKTFSVGETIGVGVEKLRSCTNFTRVSNGYRCEE